MSNSVHGDSSAAAWHAQTLSSIESYASAEADAAAEAYWKQQNQQTEVTTGSYHADGVDSPTPNQRALDAFLGPDAARGGTAIGASSSEIDRINPDGSVSNKQQVAAEGHGANWDDAKRKGQL